MKISINCKKIEGSYGGVITFYKLLEQYLSKNGHSVVNHLRDDDIDIILITAHSKLSTASFSFFDAHIYKIRHNNAIVINRVNNSDAGRNSKNLNMIYLQISAFSDHNIFISQWVRNIFPQINDENSSIIRNGGDCQIFNTNGKKFWNKHAPLKIVTHHWSTNLNKGHEIYRELDRLIENAVIKDIEFCFIGNFPTHLKDEFKHTRFILPKSGLDLAKELKNHDVYITAAKNEAGGMHHIEGALCGLPLLFINSGALPEYCSPYGLMVERDTLKERIHQMKNDYDFFLKKIEKYEFTSDNTGRAYLDLFERLRKNHQSYKIPRTNIVRRYFQILQLRFSDMSLLLKQIIFGLSQRIKKMLSRCKYDS